MAEARAVAARAGHALGRRARARRRPHLLHAVLYPLLTAGAAFTLLPLAWMLSTSLKPAGDAFLFPPKWIPDPVLWGNYPQSWTILPMASAYFNSVKISLLATVGTLFTSSLAAFAFAKLSFRGRHWLFLLLLATLMIPIQVTLIPTFILFKWVGWIDTHWPLIVPPVMTNAYGVFLLRQFFATIPDDLADAGRIDGANPLQLYWSVFLPLAGPALATLGIFAFNYHWNQFLLPLIFLNKVPNFTLPMVLGMFRGAYNIEWTLMMAATTTALVPVLAIYVAGQRYFVSGIALTGLKG